MDRIMKNTINFIEYCKIVITVPTCMDPSIILFELTSKITTLDIFIINIIAGIRQDVILLTKRFKLKKLLLVSLNLFV